MFVYQYEVVYGLIEFCMNCFLCINIIIIYLWVNDIDTNPNALKHMRNVYYQWYLVKTAIFIDNWYLMPVAFWEFEYGEC